MYFHGVKRKQLIAKEESEGYSLSVLHRNYVTMICCHYKERGHTNGWKRRYLAIPTFCNALTYEVCNGGRCTKVIPSNPNIPQCTDLWGTQLGKVYKGDTKQSQHSAMHRPMRYTMGEGVTRWYQAIQTFRNAPTYHYKTPSSPIPTSHN
jgi:hypothetical protein